jgi:hypothetical protein
MSRRLPVHMTGIAFPVPIRRTFPEADFWSRTMPRLGHDPGRNAERFSRLARASPRYRLRVNRRCQGVDLDPNLARCNQHLCARRLAGRMDSSRNPQSVGVSDRLTVDRSRNVKIKLTARVVTATSSMMAE